VENPFEKPGRWFKANLHSHCTNSDGWLPPERLIRTYSDGGYHVLAITDHWKATDLSDKSTDDFLVLPGAELDTGHLQRPHYHIVSVGVAAVPERKAIASGQDLVDWIIRSGGVAILAHPYWTGLSTEEMLALNGCVAVEVYNTGCEIEIGRGFSYVQWDDLLSRGRRLGAVAVDDGHRPAFDHLYAWTWIKAPALTRDHILQALRDGCYYSSIGPRLHYVSIQQGRIRVSCSPVRVISVVCNPSEGHQLRAPEGETLTEAEFPLPRCAYARVQVVDTVGRLAWSNPFFPT